MTDKENEGNDHGDEDERVEDGESDRHHRSRYPRTD